MAQRVVWLHSACMKLVDVKLSGIRTVRQSVLLVSNLVFAIVWFTWVVTLLAMGAGTAITVVGVPLLALTVRSGRAVGSFERRRLLTFTGSTLQPPRAKVASSGFWSWIRESFKDRAGWKGLAYGVVMLPWSVLTFTSVVSLWTVGLAGVTAPFYDWALPNGSTDFGSYEFTGWGRIGLIATYVVGGALVLIVLPVIVDFLARVQITLSRSLLSIGHAALLEQKVDELDRSRSDTIAAAEAERRRIERDLHDGTQQRLTGVAIDLGIARERLTVVGDEQSLELVDRAHEGVKEAIAELRNLVRGIHPAILTDRGLDAAVSALVARISANVAVHSDLNRRLAPEVESTAYFTVAELLTNIMKHSTATSAMLLIHDSGEILEVEVFDNGRGGASVQPGGGLDGLQGRLRAIGGVIDVVSPSGGPTRVKATIPCALS
ncbi:MAG: sensor histidine kinase [Ilumatobacteraceae bacterium]|nr:sensor histidine kinase [Ilumatobacteraceae bacterium]